MMQAIGKMTTAAIQAIDSVGSELYKQMHTYIHKWIGTHIWIARHIARRTKGQIDIRKDTKTDTEGPS